MPWQGPVSGSNLRSQGLAKIQIMETIFDEVAIKLIAVNAIFAFATIQCNC